MDFSEYEEPIEGTDDFVKYREEYENRYVTHRYMILKAKLELSQSGWWYQFLSLSCRPHHLQKVYLKAAGRLYRRLRNDGVLQRETFRQMAL